MTVDIHVPSTGDCSDDPPVSSIGQMQPQAESEPAALRLATIDDHPIVVAGILWTLQQNAPWIEFARTATTVTELLASSEPMADIVLLDLDLGHSASGQEDNDPSENVRRLMSAGATVLIFTSENRPIPIRRAIRAGAAGLILKSDPINLLIEAICQARDGKFAVSSHLAHTLVTDGDLATHLAPRELQVLELLADGIARKDIGRLLDPPVSDHTVETFFKRAAKAYRDAGRSTFNSYETLRHAVIDGHVTIRPKPN